MNPQGTTQQPSASTSTRHIISQKVEVQEFRPSNGGPKFVMGGPKALGSRSACDFPQILRALVTILCVGLALASAWSIIKTFVFIRTALPTEHYEFCYRPGPKEWPKPVLCFDEPPSPEQCQTKIISVSTEDSKSGGHFIIIGFLLLDNFAFWVFVVVHSIEFCCCACCLRIGCGGCCFWCKQTNHQHALCIDFCSLPLLLLLVSAAGICTFYGVGMDAEVRHEIGEPLEDAVSAYCINGENPCHAYWPLYTKQEGKVVPINVTEFNCEETEEYKIELKKELEFAFWFSVPVTCVALLVIALSIYVLKAHPTTPSSSSSSGASNHSPTDPAPQDYTAVPLVPVIEIPETTELDDAEDIEL